MARNGYTKRKYWHPDDLVEGYSYRVQFCRDGSDKIERFKLDFIRMGRNGRRLYLTFARGELVQWIPWLSILTIEEA